MSRLWPAAIIAVLAGTALAVVVTTGGPEDDDVKHATSTAAGDRPPVQFMRECERSIIGAEGDPKPSDVVVGPLRLHGIRAAARLPRRDFRARRGRYLALKAVTSLDNGHRVLLAVRDKKQRSTVSLLYDGRRFRDDGRYRLSDGVHTVLLVGCPGGKSPSGRVTQFNGGFIVTRPICLELDVYVDRAKQPRRASIPFGVPARSCKR